MGINDTLILLFVYLFLLQFLVVLGAEYERGKNPRLGFTALPLNSSNFVIQSSYDLATRERYSFVAGVHKLWVLAMDKPHALTSHTSPRTEIRIQGYDYSSGVWQFEGHAYNGVLMYYRSVLVLDDIYGRWFKVNVIHDTGKGLVSVFIGDLKLVVNDTGGASHYFKCGVYTQNYSSYFMESRWKKIKVLKLSD